MGERPGERRPIGRVLVERRALNARAVGAAALVTATSCGRPGSSLLDASACDERDLASALAERHGVPGVDLSRSVLDLAPLRAVPRQVAEADAILPLSTEGGRIHLAVASPDASERIVDEVRFVTGLEVSIYVAVLAALREAIAGAYAAHAGGAATWRGQAAPRDALPRLAVLTAATRSLRELSSIAAGAPDEAAVDIELSEARSLEVEQGARGGPAADPHEAVIEFEAMGGEELVYAVDVRAGPRRILVVDDEPAIRLLAQRALEHHGFEVIAAADGAEALDKARRERPDLVLLDAMLPKLHGFDVARRLRSDEATRDTPVVIMSAVYRGWRFASDARDLYGARDYVEKPFRAEGLVRCVEAALARGDSEQVGSAQPALACGRAAAEDGRSEEALAAFEQAVASDPFSDEAHWELGQSLRARGDVFRAMTELERAVDLRPEFLPALKSLAELYLETGFRAKAADALERALRAAPDDAARAALRAELLKLL